MVVGVFGVNKIRNNEKLTLLWASASLVLWKMIASNL